MVQRCGKLVATFLVREGVVVVVYHSDSGGIWLPPFQLVLGRAFLVLILSITLRGYRINFACSFHFGSCFTHVCYDQ